MSVAIRAGVASIALLAFMASSSALGQSGKSYRSSSRTTSEEIRKAAGLMINPKDCSEVKKVTLPARWIDWYECAVSESSKLKLQAALAERGWQSEKDLMGAKFRLRKVDQVASIHCADQAKKCTFVIQYLKAA